MTQTSPRIDLGRTIRAMRRRADLSQRELAEKSGVPQATIARIESGRAADPRFRTIEALVAAVQGQIVMSVPSAGGGVEVGGGIEAEAAGHGVAEEGGGQATGGLPAVPHDELRDAVGRRYPAHLDAWPVREPKDWPGAWWADWYDLPPERWPLPLPEATYERNRGYRDRRRRAERVRREFSVRRVVGLGRPATSWRFVAELPDGELVGELRAHERTLHLAYGGDESVWPRDLVLDGVLVAGEHRRLGIGRGLLNALLRRMAEVRIGAVSGIAEGPGVNFLAACGFRIAPHQPLTMCLALPVSAGPGRPP
ncbi:GNAT family N-acetyltransferase [Micromonospora purpureochromogenes]|uniref:Transcriptional regulator with XRE-family HTH domain/GNAT superfamily N-acetyltransferase n=1 Tax=Micromonospora purpureochromogenes TaxID=47872 RepID=A0ABX2RMZ1_9ACTN|nr:GNAT family N-acetyltransferase [Micromonospora purpureochromogenes]NYF56578.1 transcriptional regulator with XRE-family HTH domain/GNAT superfamily N-acetyltransferase [Micromonospora purpureochromogenes]